MRKTALAFVLALAASAASAQGVQRAVPQREEVLIPAHIGAAVAASGNYGGGVQADPVTVQAITMRVSTGGGGGAGNVVVRVSDGTNNCDATFACTGTGVTQVGASGPKRAATTGACTFAASALLTVSVPTAGCTSTQPAVQNLAVLGKRH